MMSRAVPKGIAIVGLLMMVVLGSWAIAGPTRQQSALLEQVITDLKQLNSTQLNFPGRFTPDLTEERRRLGVDSEQIESWWRGYTELDARLQSDARSVSLAEIQLLADRVRAGNERLSQLLQFWSEWRAISGRVSLWRSFVAINRITSPYDAEIAALTERLARERTAAQFELARSSTVPALAALYEKGFSEGYEQAWEVVREDRLEQARSQPCPDPPSQAMPAMIPKVGNTPQGPRLDTRRSASTSGFYPDAQRRLAIEGRVGLGVEVDAGGCARRAIVRVSSGDLELDSSAVRYVLTGAVFHPLLVDGTASPGVARMFFRFRIRD